MYLRENYLLLLVLHINYNNKIYLKYNSIFCIKPTFVCLYYGANLIKEYASPKKLIKIVDENVLAIKDISALTHFL